MTHCKLSDVLIGQKYKITKIMLDGDILKRLQELGFIENEIIECKLKAPLNDPKAYFVKGTVIAIRNDIAKNIYVKEV